MHCFLLIGKGYVGSRLARLLSKTERVLHLSAREVMRRPNILHSGPLIGKGSYISAKVTIVFCHGQDVFRATTPKALDAALFSRTEPLRKVVKFLEAAGERLVIQSLILISSTAAVVEGKASADHYTYSGPPDSIMNLQLQYEEFFQELFQSRFNTGVIRVGIVKDEDSQLVRILRRGNRSALGRRLRLATDILVPTTAMSTVAQKVRSCPSGFTEYAVDQLESFNSLLNQFQPAEFHFPIPNRIYFLILRAMGYRTEAYVDHRPWRRLMLENGNHL